MMMIRRVLAVAALLALTGCWDKVEHTYDCGDTPTGGDADTDSDVDTDSDADSDADGGDADGGQGQGDVPEGWEGFGTPCLADEDCGGYPGERRCVTDVLGLINAPGGFCTACCDAEAADGCAQNIDCVGANNVYLVCIAHCDSHQDCRQEEGWECRPIYYIPDQFPGDFCLPDEEHVEPDTDGIMDLDCPWPWL